MMDRRTTHVIKQAWQKSGWEGTGCPSGGAGSQVIRSAQNWEQFWTTVMSSLNVLTASTYWNRLKKIWIRDIHLHLFLPHFFNCQGVAGLGGSSSLPFWTSSRDSIVVSSSVSTTWLQLKFFTAAQNLNPSCNMVACRQDWEMCGG